jgi:hypothetical protein
VTLVPVRLIYSEKLAVSDSWRIARTVGPLAIEARVGVAAAREALVTVGLRRWSASIETRKSSHDARIDEMVFVRQIDEDQWTTSLVRHPDIPLVGFLLSNCPEDVSKQLRELHEPRTARNLETER